MSTELRIILVDDCPDLRRMYVNAILGLSKDMTVLAFGDGQVAWQALMTRDPDLLISDLVHPGMDGFEMLRLLARWRMKYPVLIVSGNLPGREAEAKACAGHELNVTFLPKPFSMSLFSELVRRSLGICH